MITVAEALRQAREVLKTSDSPRLDGELLLAHVLKLGRAKLHARPERRLLENEAKEFQKLLERRRNREPVAYLLGSAGFMDFELEVDPSVLIPRPETELLVELALDTLGEQSGKPVAIADLGTGSGAIAIALASHDPVWSVLGVDTSADALALARRNAAALAANNLRFQSGSWCSGLNPGSFDMIVANPPYVTVGDPALHPDCAWEPPVALFAGEDGLAAIREIIPQARRCLKPGGRLLLEHGFDQRTRVVELLKSNRYRNIECFSDHGNHDRLVRARTALPVLE